MKKDWSNREYRLQYYKDHYRRNRAKRLEDAKERFQENKEERLQYQRDYRDKNREKINKRQRDCYQKYKLVLKAKRELSRGTLVIVAKKILDTNP